MFDLLFSIISVTLGIFKDVDVDPKRFKNEAGVSMFVARGGGDDVGIVHGKVREISVYCTCWCTRCVTSSTANNMKIHARITLNVEFIRTCIFLF